MQNLKFKPLYWLAILATACKNEPKSAQTKSVQADSVLQANIMAQLKTNYAASVSSDINLVAQSNKGTVFFSKPKTVEKKLVLETPSKESQPQNNMNLADFYTKNTKHTQIFTINSSKDTVIIANEGTKLYFKANTLVSDKTGEIVQGNVEVAIQEFYKISDIILAKFSTNSNAECLETGGMLHIAVSKIGDKLALQTDKTFDIAFPTQALKPDMQLFKGEWTDQNQINWTLNTPKNTEKIFEFVQERPQFTGGEKALMEYLSTAIVYPAKALGLGIKAKIYTSFVVNQDGSISDAKILRGVNGYGLNEACIRAITNMPKWKPGKQDGIPVNVRYILPCAFDFEGGSFIESTITQTDMDTSSYRTINYRDDFEKDTTNLTKIQRINAYQPFLALQKTETNMMQDENLVFEPVTMDLLKAKMQELDKL